MAEVELTKGFRAVIDDEDFHQVMRLRWRALRDRRGTHCAVSSGLVNGHNVTVYMHRLITGAPAGVMVDHIYRDPLDNRKANLRLATNAQNQWNRGCSGSIALKGVIKGRPGRFIARIAVDRKQSYLGSFSSAEAAARAYDEAAIRLHCEFAATNVSLGLLPPLAEA